MSKDTDFLRDAILSDSDGNRARIIEIQGAEAGLDHLEVTTQSKWERENGIATKHRIYTEECTVEQGRQA